MVLRAQLATAGGVVLFSLVLRFLGFFPGFYLVILVFMMLTIAMVLVGTIDFVARQFINNGRVLKRMRHRDGGPDLPLSQQLCPMCGCITCETAVELGDVKVCQSCKELYAQVLREGL